MKRIAILTCLRANDVCTGAGCLEAFFNKKGSFNIYKQENIKLVAFWTCNGCKDCLFDNQDGLFEKIDKIKKLKVDILHLGICVLLDKKSKKFCPKIQNIIEELKKYNIKIVIGTHS